MANPMITHPYVDKLDEWNARGLSIADALEFAAANSDVRGADAALSLLVELLADHLRGCPFPDREHLRDWEINRPKS